MNEDRGISTREKKAKNPLAGNQRHKPRVDRLSTAEPAYNRLQGNKDLPLGADKTHSGSKGVFSVFSNDKNKNYDTLRSAWEFAKNQEQPQVSRLIRLEATLL